VLAFVRAALPVPPARLLEVGAGRGELAAVLRDAGYEVVAVDPAADDDAAGVWPIALHEVGEADGSFDGAIAVLSLHHVEPLPESCARLAALVREDGLLVVDEFDVERFDERAARWLRAQRAAAGADDPDDHHADHHADVAAWVADLRAELHPVDALRDALDPPFALGEPVRGPYLYRWDVDPALRVVEEGLIARGELPATGARLVGRRR
jgi:SAM-dependent methyltransferase